MRNKINLVFQQGGLQRLVISANIRTCINAVLKAEGVTAKCEINVLVTDDAGIREINRTSRNIDSATDVLSFPMFDLAEGEHPDECDPETGRVPLGDMCISVERARAQAREYGHSFEREICYLAVHSTLHLLGYDHMDEGERKRRMRGREEAVMSALKLEK